MGIESRSKYLRFVKDLMDKGRCVSCVFCRTRCVSEFGRETWSIDVSGVLYRLRVVSEFGRETWSIDVSSVYDKSKRVNCDRCEKASLEMVEMGLLDRSRRSRLLELGFVNVRAVTEVMALM